MPPPLVPQGFDEERSQSLPGKGLESDFDALEAHAVIGEGLQGSIDRIEVGLSSALHAVPLVGIVQGGDQSFREVLGEHDATYELDL